MQVLLLLLGFYGHFVNFVRGNGQLVAYGRARMHNDCNTRTLVIMQTAKIGKHVVEFFDAIEELPIVRFHKYEKLILIDAGIGADIAAFDQRTERMRQFIAAGKTENAQQELENMRQCVYMIQTGLNPRHLAFAALVTKIDGKVCDDLSDDALAEVTRKLNDSPASKLAALLEAAKKKIDGELMLYFPALFNDSDVKEYYDLMRARALEILKGIIAGEKDPAGTANVKKLTTELVTHSKPKVFTGSDGVEIQFDRQFENLCLTLSEQLHVEPKKLSVLEFYNAFDFVKERAQQLEKAQKRGRN